MDRWRLWVSGWGVTGGGMGRGAQTFAIQDGGTLPACPQPVFCVSVGRCVSGWGGVGVHRGGVRSL